MEIGDNVRLLIRARNKETYKLAMQLGFMEWEIAVGYSVSKEEGLVFYWSLPSPVGGFKDLPFDMDYKEATEFAWSWLQKLDWDKFDFPLSGEDVDHDGDNERGWQVWNGVDKWDDEEKDNYPDGRAFVAVRPAYIWLGK